MSASQPIPLKRYVAEPNLAANNTHARVIRLVGRDRRVLELGCATGYISRALTNEFGCVVTGVEVNPAAAEEARATCARVIVGDLDAIDWHETLGAEQFDVVVAADVLEHLRNPAGVLAAVRPYLAPGGHLVASIPNVAHTSVLAELLQGRFMYRPFGLLDDTHIRFFTRDSIYECLEEAGFAITHLDRLRLEPAETEFRTTLSSFPTEVVNWLASREESTTYQFVLVAHPMAPASVTVVQPTWPRSTIDDAESGYRCVLEGMAAQPGGSAVDGVLRAHAARLAYLENTRAHQSEFIARLQEALAKHEVYIGEVTAESQRRHEELSKAQTYVTSLIAEIDKLRGELKSAGDHATGLRQALAASERRLLQERQRMGDSLKLNLNRSPREREEERLLRDLKNLSEERQRLQEERTRLAGDLKDVEEERTRLTRDLKGVEEERERLTRDLEEERTRLTRDLEEERARSARELERQEQVIAWMKTSIDTYERSRSWRVTAPLRAWARLVARLRHP
jgi:2-polyprenyl-3-methyl-5-hydroxy-6-metoxy-1,4-benzoquinol methylase